MRGGTKELATSCVSQIKLDARLHWIRQRTMETHIKRCHHQYFSAGCAGRSAFQALASAVTPPREESSVASGCNALHGWPCPYCNAMMKSPAGLDDEVCRCVADSVPCQDGNPILSRQVACHNLSTIGKQVLTETSDAPTTYLRKKRPR